ncbi:Heavy metal RND efflux outer membrane protein, CzcC family [hydrothermal vent metagenome]|uniref:Heavy metal RND efflux outer membrane protein, CzcC family n=1 Tax=hydrothermal vent metagenome TaxID=652676 RepID=A0A3B1BRW6_9ZZZZ
MSRPTGVWFCLASALFLLATQGCATSKPNSDFEQIANEVATSIARTNIHQNLETTKLFEMETAVSIALDNNPSLASIRRGVAMAVEKYPQVTAFDDPMLGVGFFPSTAGANGGNFAYKIDFKQRIFYPGKLRLKGEKAIAEATASLNDFGSAKVKLASLVKSAYLELFFAHRAIEVNEENKKLLQEFKTIAEAQYSAGKGNLQDVIQADLDLAKAEHNDIMFERKLKVATARLNTLMGRKAQLPLPAPARLPLMPPLPDKEILLKKALNKNPSIKAARFKIEAHNLSLKLAHAQSYPDFTFTGSYNRAWAKDELRPFVGVSINIPLLSSRLRAKKNIAKIKLNQANSDLTAKENDIRFEIENAWQRLKEFHHSEKIFSEIIVPQTKLNLNAARAGYRNGGNDFLTLVTAERSMVNTKLKYERVLVNLRLMQAMLLEAVGTNK